MPDWVPMHAWHPLTVHFPIAFLVVGPVLEVAGWLTRRSAIRAAGLVMLAVGVLLSIPAVASGLIAYDRVDHSDASHAAMTLHRNLMLVSTLGFAALAGWRLLRRDAVFARPATAAFYSVLALGGAVVVGVGGHMGSDLVFTHGTGLSDGRIQAIVDARGGHGHGPDAAPHDHPVAGEGEAGIKAADPEHPPGTPAHEHPPAGGAADTAKASQGHTHPPGTPPHSH